MTKGTRFDVASEFRKLFKDIPTIAEDEETNKTLIPPADRRVYYDPANVCGVIPKQPWVLEALKSTMFLPDPHVMPLLNYVVSGGAPARSKYSSEYLKVIIELCRHYDVVTLSLKDTYPLYVETPDFDFVLAPRVDTD
jgi:hypothetical protein